MNIIKKTFVLLLTLCAVFALAAFPASADDVIINPELIFTPQTTLSVLVDGTANGALSGNYPYGETATVTAPDVAGKTFQYWTNGEGAVISYNKALTVTMYANTTVNAVYGASAAEAKTTAAFLNVTRTDGEIVFNAIASSENAGIRYSTTKRTLNDLKGEDGVTVAAADEAPNWTLIVTPNDENTTYYAVVYATVGTETTYSDVKAVKLSELQNGVSMVVNLGDIDLSKIKADFCVVTFDANGGEGIMAPQGVVKGEAAVLSANTFTREGYTFNGWSTDPNGGGTTYKDGDTVTLSEDTTLYAQWSSSNTYVVSTTFDNTISKTEHGTIKLEPEKAAANKPVNVTATPDAGYKLAELTVKDASGKEVELKKNDDGTYTFVQPNGKVTVEAKFAKVKFVDVPENSYYAKAVDWAVEKGITNGVDDTHFAPDATCTRAQAVTFLWRALGCPEPTATKSEFTDVTDANAFYFKAVLWAAENGVTNGIGDGSFGVNGIVNRAQMVTFMARALNGKATTAESFADVPEGAYFADAAAWAKENGVSAGIGDNKFGGEIDCLRAQIVTMLYRYFVK